MPGHYTHWVMLLVRICLVLMFPFSAIDKVIHWDESLAQANSSFLPGGLLLLVMAMMIETLTPLCIVLQWHAQAAALVLSAFCVMTALLYHRFWEQGDFWPKSTSLARQNFWDFTKNFGLAGGLLLVTMGAGLAT